MSETLTASPWLDSSEKPYIQIENVTKKFGDFTAIDNLKLDIYKNEFFSLLGPSGCGKTTLLRMLAGFEKITDGRILLDGEDISEIPPHLRPINMMFQSYALFPHMTVEKNITFGMKVRKINKIFQKQKLLEVSKQLQIGHLLDRKPSQLSGGQRQRIAIARALYNNPDLLVFDEATSALDGLTEKSIMKSINALSKVLLSILLSYLNIYFS